MKALGTKRWPEVAKLVHSECKARNIFRVQRTSKSCRIRWSNQLDASLNFDPFSPNEEALILQVGVEATPCSQTLRGRPDYSIMQEYLLRVPLDT